MNELSCLLEGILFASGEPVYAQKLNKDYTYAVQLVCVSTLLSICTMPVIAALAQQIFPVG